MGVTSVKAAALYGLLAGIVLGILNGPFLQPFGAILGWGLIAVQLTSGAFLTWRRMRLFFSTLAMAMGALEAILVASLYAAGYDLLSLPLPWAIVVWGGLIVGTIVLHLDAYWSPEKWEAWRRHMDDAGLVDVLRGHHIPDLTPRAGGSSR
jgi:hypothetical protein